jgi:hypothetical protein
VRASTGRIGGDTHARAGRTIGSSGFQPTPGDGDREQLLSPGLQGSPRHLRSPTCSLGQPLAGRRICAATPRSGGIRADGRVRRCMESGSGRGMDESCEVRAASLVRHRLIGSRSGPARGLERAIIPKTSIPAAEVCACSFEPPRSVARQASGREESSVIVRRGDPVRRGGTTACPRSCSAQSPLTNDKPSET